MTSKQRASAARAYSRLCKYLGISFRGETFDTPARVVKALEEMTCNHNVIISTVGQKLPFNFTTFKNPGDGLVTIKGIEFTSLCAHHHMPFMGTMCVGYLPDKLIVGLSKIPRLVDFFSKTPTLQETLTNRLADELQARLAAQGVIVASKSMHLCVCARGVEKNGSETLVTAVRGPHGLTIKDEILRHL